MAKEILLNVRVNDKDLDTLQAELGQTEQAFRDVTNEAQKTSKSVDDVASNGGAIAVLDRLTGGLASQLRDAYEASRLFNASLRASRAALISTGIGAFVVALGVVVAYWDEIVELITGANRRLEDYRKLSEQTAGVLGQEIGLLEKRIELTEKQGGNTEQLQKQKVVLLNQQQKLLDQQRSILKTQIARLKATQEELTLTGFLEGAWGFIKGGYEGLARVGQDQATAFSTKLNELESALLGVETQAVETEIALFNALNPEQPEGVETQERNIGEGVSTLNPQDAVRLTSAKMLREALVQNANETGDELYQTAVKDAQKLYKVDQIAAENKMKLMSSVADAAMALSGVLGQETAAGKGLAAAAALIDTYAAISGQLKAFSGIPIPGYAIAQAIATGAVGFANVRRILSVQVPNTGGRGVTVPPGANAGAGAPAARTPQFNLIGDAGINQLDESINRQNNRPTRAYVVANDVTTAQELERSTISSAAV